MSTPALAPSIDTTFEELTEGLFEEAKHFALVVHDDPVNLISYVARVFQKHFKLSKEEAMLHTLEIHNSGQSILATGERVLMEAHAEVMHNFGLWATVEAA